MPSDELDRLLVARIRQGDPQAWNDCIARFEGRLLAFVDSRLRNRAQSEDVVQETFLGFVIAPLSAASVLIFAAALGFLWLGTVPLTTSLVGYIFGPVHVTMLNGIVFFGHQVGSFFGGWGGGRLFDLQGNYDMMWWISIALGVVSAALHYPIVEERLVRPTSIPQPA